MSLFNGQIENKFKMPYNNDVFCSEVVNDKLQEITMEPGKVPMPTELLRHEIDRDEKLQDTILGLCDKNGYPLKWKYLANNLEDVMSLLQTEEFFDYIPMSEDFTYHVARDWCGIPITKKEMSNTEFMRRIFEKRAMEERKAYEERIKKAQQMRAESLKKVKTTTFETKNTTLTF